MKLTSMTVVLLLGLPVTTVSAQQVFCSQHSRFIDVGMSVNEVISACGEPIRKEKSNVPVTTRIPVQQLIYTATDTGSVYPTLDDAFYNTWSLPSGTSGVNVEVDLVNDKVKAMRINGSGINAMTVCNNNKIEIGASSGAVYSACGTPTLINSTYINQQVQSETQPEVWTFKMGDYQPPMSLTFVDGKLQSIN